jgi:hypothetical protein
MKIRASILLFVMAGCGGKEPVVEDFTELASLDEKSDRFTSRFRVVGSLAYGDSESWDYRNPPRYPAFKFYGRKGDPVSIDVHSGRDAVAFLLDGSYNIVGYGDDDLEHDTLDAHIETTLRSTGSHYIAFREYYARSTAFRVVLKSGPDKVCSYDGTSYSEGESFPSLDGCNTCTCGADGSVPCTKRLCDSCDQPGRDYVSRDASDCARLRYFCIATMKSFSDACGCGCEPIDI